MAAVGVDEGVAIGVAEGVFPRDMDTPEIPHVVIKFYSFAASAKSTVSP